MRSRYSKKARNRKDRKDTPKTPGAGLIDVLTARVVIRAKTEPPKTDGAIGIEGKNLWEQFHSLCHGALGPYLGVLDKEMEELVDFEMTGLLNRGGIEQLKKELSGALEESSSRFNCLPSAFLQLVLRPLAMLENPEIPGEEELRALGLNLPRRGGPTQDKTAPADPAAPPEAESTLEECRALWGKGHRDLNSELPQCFVLALERATCDEERNRVKETVRRLTGATQGGSKAYSKLPTLVEALRTLDPGLIFDFAKTPLFAEGVRPEDFIEKVSERFKALCPNRDRQIEEMLLSVAQRMTGDTDTLYPLFYGPPGTGKTFLVELANEVFNEAGLASRSILQAMTQNGGYNLQNNEVAMSLQGISSQWSDARPGMLFRNCGGLDNALCLTVLDEVDKCAYHDFLVTLIDPRQPLQDSYVREFIPELDMRHKCLFFLTANDIGKMETVSGGAFWSRVAPIEMPAYTREEAGELVTRLVWRRLEEKDFSEEQIRTLTGEVLMRYPLILPSVRVLLAEVKRRIAQKRFPFLQGIETHRPTSSRKLGFFMPGMEPEDGNKPTTH
ncbi:MAG: AAA family ATPase [Trichloromonas sp.]|jgi:hypothetical protein|nr:AAA family ATPase [Trichloromonas sp.]